MIDPLSLISLLIEPCFNEQPLGFATGFIIKDIEKIYLATNWHVVTGKHPVTGKVIHAKGGLPNFLIVWFHKAFTTDNISWTSIKIPLYSSERIDEEEKRWLEHPRGKDIDVILLPVDLPTGINIFPINMNLADVDMVATPAMPISLIGFPRGKTAGGKLPIWVTGYIASEPIINVDYLPMFYANALGEQGLSGAPVILRLFGNYFTNDRSFIMSSSGCKNKFMGIYSGRICEGSNICHVWKPIVIEKILEYRTQILKTN